jgi:hypothetical protein
MNLEMLGFILLGALLTGIFVGFFTSCIFRPWV